MQINVEKLPKSTIKLTVIVPIDKVKEGYEKIVESAVKETEIEGFRKGLAPRKMVEDKIGVSKLYGDLINDLLQQYYPQALKENHITPISNPKVEIKAFDIEKDFEFTATVATRPEVIIEEFKEELKKSFQLRKDTKKKENEERLKKGEKLDESHIHMGSNDVIQVLLSKSKVDVPDLIVEEETDRMMSRLIDQAQSIGMSLDQYLKAQNKTSEQLRADYTKIAEDNLKAEFVMGELVNKEKIEVSDDEITNTIIASGLEGADERAKDPMDRLYVKSILQKNKLINKLIEETEGEDHHEH